MLKVCILSVKTSDYETEDILLQVEEKIRMLHLRLSKEEHKQFRVAVDIKLLVSDADLTSIPGITFRAGYVSLASELGIRTNFHLEINSSTKRGLMNSGTHFLVESEREIDICTLNKITGLDPHIVYRMGDKGKYAIVDFNAWGYEISNNNMLPDVSVSALILALPNAKEVGLYCKKNNLVTHIDITCYGISPDPLCFQLEPTFFIFANNLSVQYVDLDFMN